MQDIKKTWFQAPSEIFYKNDLNQHEDWVNKEVMVQLNITSKCPLTCPFCYIKEKHSSTELSLKMIQKFWENLRKYHNEQGIVYRINITGGDIFYHSEIKEILEFVKNEKSIVSIDPLINRIWNEEQKKLLGIIINKIEWIQFNPTVVTDEDIEFATKHNKLVILKYPLYKGAAKKEIKKIKDLVLKYNNVYFSFDMIVPQKGNKHTYGITYIDDEKSWIKEAKEIIQQIPKEKIMLLNCALERELNNRTFLCGVGLQNIYVMPNGSMPPCSRFCHLSTGFNIDNFDLKKYINKFNCLISNTCLYENKYFNNFWDEKENPKEFIKNETKNSI
jgi:organic radical activating enzyme